MPRDLPLVTLQDVILSDVRGMKVSTGPVIAYVRYGVRATSEGETEVHHTAGIAVSMPTQLKQDLAAWIASDVLPAINTQEGTI